MTCPKCAHTEFWRVRREKCRCSACGYEWRPGRLPLHLTSGEWVLLLKWFLKGKSIAELSDKTGLHKQRVMRAVHYIRRAMLIGSMLNHKFRLEETLEKQIKRGKYAFKVKRGIHKSFGGYKPPVFCVCLDNPYGYVKALVLPEMSDRDLFTIINKCIGEGWIFYSKRWANEDVILKSNYKYYYRAIEGDRRYSWVLYAYGMYREDKITEVLNYILDRLSCFRGVRRYRLPLFLADIVWRYNYVNYNNNRKLHLLLSWLPKTLWPCYRSPLIP